MLNVRFSSKVYTDAFQNDWLNSLAVYILLCKRHSGKSFYFKPKQKTKLLQNISKLTGIGYTSLNHHIKILVDKGMIKFFDSGEMKLVGNDKVTNRINGYKLMFVNEQVNTLSDIKLLLKSIPFLSNLLRQKKAHDKKEHYEYIKDNPKEFTWKTNRQLRIFLQKGGTFDRCEEIFCGINKIKELVYKKSHTTVCNYKKKLKELRLIQYTNKWHAIYTNVTYADFVYLRSSDLVCYNNIFFHKGSIYINRPTEFMLSYHNANICL